MTVAKIGPPSATAPRRQTGRAQPAAITISQASTTLAGIGNVCEALNYEQEPVLGAARPGISGAERATILPHTGFIGMIDLAQPNALYSCDQLPVVGAAFPGISGAKTADDIIPRSVTEAATELAAASRQPADYDEAPVLGAAFPGISSAVVADDLTPRNMTKAATELAAASRQPADYDEAPVLGAAFPGISGAQMAAELVPTAHQSAAVSNRKNARLALIEQPGIEQPGLGTADSGSRNGKPVKGTGVIEKNGI